MLKIISTSSLIAAIVTLHLSTAYCQEISDRVNVGELNQLIGKWEGKHIYLENNSGKPGEMAVELTISKSEKNETLILSRVFPKATKATSIDSLCILADGTFINGESVISKRKNELNEIEIVTEKNGIDTKEQKPAIFRFHYLISADQFKIIKEVQFPGTQPWYRRSEFTYHKK